MKTRLIRYAAFLIGIARVTTLPALATDLHVPNDYEIIQDAVEAATSGDTIHIAPGVYEQQVTVVNKDLTLLGRPGTILRAFTNMADTGLGWRTVILARDTSNVVVRGLTLEGERVAGDQPVSSETGAEFGTRAIYFATAGGAVENCRITGFREAGPVSAGARQVSAIVAIIDPSNSNPSERHIRITGNTISDCYNGIWLQGTLSESDQPDINATIQDNSIHGLGPIDTRSNNQPFAGITIVRNVQATVTGNTITGFSYAGIDGFFPFNLGILVYGGGYPNFIPTKPMRFENNYFRDNDVHLMAFKGDGHEIINNRFEGNGVAVRQAGIQFSGEQVVVSGNEFHNMPLGISALGDDPQFGFVFGVATNAQIENNRFRDVETTIELQPQATASESGSLVHPFPSPELIITRTVRVSWPGYYAEDYVLESAPTSEGPWTEMATELRLVDGTLQATVEVNGQQQYFRLRAP